MFIEILFKMLLFKGGVLIYAEHCMDMQNALKKEKYIYTIFKVQGFFICHIIVIQCIIRSEM